MKFPIDVPLGSQREMMGRFVLHVTRKNVSFPTVLSMITVPFSQGLLVRINPLLSSCLNIFLKLIMVGKCNFILNSVFLF